MRRHRRLNAPPPAPERPRITPAEAVICSDDTLAALDRALTALYDNKYNSLPTAQRDALIAAEKAWIAERDSCGTNKFLHQQCL